MKMPFPCDDIKNAIDKLRLDDINTLQNDENNSIS